MRTALGLAEADSTGVAAATAFPDDVLAGVEDAFTLDADVEVEVEALAGVELDVEVLAEAEVGVEVLALAG